MKGNRDEIVGMAGDSMNGGEVVSQLLDDEAPGGDVGTSGGSMNGGEEVLALLGAHPATWERLVEA